MKKLVFRSSLILLLLALTLGIYIYDQIFSSITKSDQIILVPTGTSLSELKDTLRSNNLLNNEVVFELTIKTDTPQLYRNGGIVQLEYLIQNIFYQIHLQHL